jgi:hypothetical protein
VNSGSWSSAAASDSATFNDNGEYAIWVYRKQRYVYVAAIDLGGPGGGAMAEFEYDSTADLGPGKSGAYFDATSFEVDVYKAIDGAAQESLAPRFRGLAESSISSGELLVEGGSRGGEAVIEGFSDDDYMLQADVKLNGGETADIWMRYQDSNNGYCFRLDDSANMQLFKVEKGK